MGTRGLYGFVLGDQEKLSYNHWDSYPAGLGTETLKFLSGGVDLDALKSQVENLRVLSQEEIDEGPTDEDREKYGQYADSGVNRGQGWYSLLRDTQGDWQKTLEAGIIEDSATFASNSLFCEWGYVINLDTGFLEVYEGFQREPHEEGRFADRVEIVPKAEPGDYQRDQYYPIKLVAAYSLRELPTAEQLEEDCDPPEEGEE